MPPYRDKSVKPPRWRYKGVLDGREFSGSSPKGDNTKAAAVAAETEHIRKLRARVFTGVMPTVAEFVEKFLTHQKSHTAALTQDGQRAHLLLHVVPMLGTKPLDAIERRHVDQLVAHWTEAGTAKTTINTRLDTIRSMFALAVEWRYLAAAPTFRRIKVPKDTPRFLTYDEAARLIAAAAPQWRSMVVVGLRTGLRIGELRGLQWGDVDLERRAVRVRRTDPGRPDLGPNAPKGKRERTVPLSADAAAALTSERPKDPKASELVWPALEWRGRRARNRSRSGSGCFHGIRSAVDASGIYEAPDDPIGWHTLRHTFASWLVMRGTHLLKVQQLLGHANTRQTERYAHLAPDASYHAEVAALDFAVLDAAPQRALKGPSSTDDNDP